MTAPTQGATQRCAGPEDESWLRQVAVASDRHRVHAVGVSRDYGALPKKNS